MNAVIDWFSGMSVAGLLSIVLADLVLSGDNALVIGAAAASLKDPRQRRKAIIFGGLCAAALRIGFTIGASYLLRIPLLQVVGGALLVYIAIKLLRGENGETPAQKERNSLMSTLWTIVGADLSMGLDNVLAVAGIASGHMPTLIVGMAISIGMLMLGSTLVAKLIERLPLLLDLASLVLAWTAGKMLLEDNRLGPILAQVPSAHLLIPAAVTAIVLIVDIVIRRRQRRARPMK